MKTSSAKAKGRRLQNTVAEDIRTLPGLMDGDVVPAIMGQGGMDITLSPGKQHIFPFAIECKNQESLSIWAAMEQAEANAPGDLIPLVVFTRNGAPTYACLSWSEMLRNFASIRYLHSQLDDMEEERDELEGERNALEDELEAVRSDLNDAEYGRDDAEGRAIELEDERDELEVERDELEVERDDLKLDVDALSLELDDLQRQLDGPDDV